MGKRGPKRTEYENGERSCTACGQVKPLSEFRHEKRPTGRRTPRSRCRSCEASHERLSPEEKARRAELRGARAGSYEAVRERLDAHAEAVGDHVLWTGSVNSRGYGQVSINGRKVLVHRLAYTIGVLDHDGIGPIPDGYEIDHLCELGKRCLVHLEAVPGSVNRDRRSLEAGEHAKIVPEPLWRWPTEDNLRLFRQQISNLMH